MPSCYPACLRVARHLLQPGSPFPGQWSLLSRRMGRLWEIDVWCHLLEPLLAWEVYGCKPTQSLGGSGLRQEGPWPASPCHHELRPCSLSGLFLQIPSCWAPAQALRTEVQAEDPQIHLAFPQPHCCPPVVEGNPPLPLIAILSEPLMAVFLLPSCHVALAGAPGGQLSMLTPAKLCKGWFTP